MDDEFLILLVDDDPAMLGILSYAARVAFPEAHFVQVRNFSELKTYFQKLHGYGPQLILLDLDLNESMNGLEVLASLRADEQMCRLPVVMLTASDSEADIVAATQVGAASFTSKPSELNGWKVYLANLRLYWMNTARVVPVWFSNEKKK